MLKLRFLTEDAAQNSLEYMLVLGAVAVVFIAVLFGAFQAIVPMIINSPCFRAVVDPLALPAYVCV
jgi:Flp pilus assembly pilin Flp